MRIAPATPPSSNGYLSKLLASLIASLVFALCGLPWLAIAPAAHASSPTALAQDQPELPPVELDALDGNRWSLTSIQVAPGQVIRVTNRGAMAHDFTVDEWAVSVPIPTLETVEVVVPEDLTPGQQFTYYCTEPGHAVLGQTGTITIVTAEQILASRPNRGGTAAPERIVIQTGDDFSFSPSTVEVTPGQVIEVQNNGVLEHHFVVDEWALNETISAGEVKLIQVPADARPGDTYSFYCSVPGHRPGGMEGVITILEPSDPDNGGGGGGDHPSAPTPTSASSCLPPTRWEPAGRSSAPATPAPSSPTTTTSAPASFPAKDAARPTSVRLAAGPRSSSCRSRRSTPPPTRSRTPCSRCSSC